MLVTILEKWKTAVDNGECVSALFLDLSKAFDTINHDLLLAKLKTYGFSPNALKLMHSYLNNRKQQVQINNKFSSESTVIAGVPQGSIDGPLLFNLFINDLVFFIQYCTLSNYADDNNLFSMGKNKDQVKTFLSSDFKIINNWFYENFMVLNPEKSHFMCIGQKIDHAETLNFNNLAIKNSKEVEILGITLDRNMNFHTHIKNICRKAGQKLSALLRISPYLDQRKKVLLYKSMIKSQFNYCPLVWMFCSRQSNNLINKVHERGLRLTCRDETKDFQQILREQNEITIHQRNLQVLMTEVYKIVNNIAPSIMNSLFHFRYNTNNIRNFKEIYTENKKTVRYGTETVTYRAPFLWANLHTKYKNAKSLDEFKSKIKAWKCDFCQCRLCKK